MAKIITEYLYSEKALDDSEIIKGQAYVHDCGTPEYLDGISSQYTVYKRKDNLEAVAAYCFSLEESVTIADALTDWLPIDYGQADSGKGCFDGEMYIFKKDNFLFFGTWDDEDRAFRLRKSELNFVYVDADPTHYRPIPADWIGGV